VAEEVFVIIEETEEIDAVGVGQCRCMLMEVVGLWAVADDPERHIVVVGDCVKGVQQQVDVLVFDQSIGKVDIVARLRMGCVLDSVDVDSVRDDCDLVSWGPLSASRSAVTPETAIGYWGVCAVAYSVNLPKRARCPRYLSQTSCHVVTSGVSVLRVVSLDARTGK
jgi:hypothetical protein